MKTSLCLAGVLTAAVSFGAVEKSLCVVHRGWGLAMPENTMIAFERCWEAGLLPEADARVSTDGVLYAFHDPTYRKRPLKTFSWAEVQAIDVGAMKGPQWAGKGIRAPTWDEIFAALAKDPRREILMDHKDAPMKGLYEAAKRHGVERQVWWCAGSIDAATKWKKLVPDGKALAWVRFGRSWKTVDYADKARLAEIDSFVAGQVRDWEKKGFGGADVVELIVNVNVKDPSVAAPSLPVVADAVRRIQKAGRKACVLVWAESADSVASYRSVEAACRPDCYGTDYPLKLLEFLGR